ncbi:uncharacterized protein LOC143922022 [Arctopsyche grandis]|uniref:uncharacterized protein LOC143922022 n=1 Tax=Arctopsyche grandis TaxID=121162 RepID=UPI00406D6D89
MCHQDEGWTEALPTVLLGIRSAWKEDLNATSAELVYGQPLRLPGEFLAPQRNGGPNTAELAERLRSQMARLRPSPPRRHGTRSTFIFKDLHTSDQVFLRHDAAKGPLQPPYDGPYRVLKRGPKFFTLRIKDSNVTVTVDRIKPAYMESSGEPPERAERTPQENAIRKWQPHRRGWQHRSPWLRQSSYWSHVVTHHAETGHTKKLITRKLVTPKNLKLVVIGRVKGFDRFPDYGNSVEFGRKCLLLDYRSVHT